MRRHSRILLLLLFLHTVTAKTTKQRGLFHNPFKSKNGKKKKSSSALAKTITTKISTAVGGTSKKSKRTASTLLNRNALLYTSQNLLAGLASAIALIPEASTFAMTAGLNPLVGLGSTIVLALTSGSIGGRPGLVSGASATVSMILKPLCEQYGHLSLSLAVVLAGIFQILLGMTRCARYIRVVPRPVMLGFVNGLSIKVVRAQIPHFQHPHGVWLRGLALQWHCILVIGSALVIDLLPKYTTMIPSPLAALALAAVVANYLDLPVPRLVDMVGPEAFQGGLGTLTQALFPFWNANNGGGGSGGILPPFFGPELLGSDSINVERFMTIVSTATEMALVGLLQSLLTIQIVDEKTQQRCGKNTQESIAQGIGNTISGIMGGMGGSALLGQSLVNVNSGGSGRLSSIAVALFVLCGVTMLAPLLGELPVAALVGLMFTVAQHTFRWDLLTDIFNGKTIPKADIGIIILVTWTTAFQSMVKAVTLGVLASALRFAWQASCNLTTNEKHIPVNRASSSSRYIRLKGQLFFASTSTFQKLCGPSEKDREIAELFRLRLANRLMKKQKKLKELRKKYNLKASSGAATPTDTTSPPSEGEPPMIPTGRETVIDFSESQVWDHAAMMAIESLARQYHDLGVKLYLKHLSPDCREKLLESSDLDQLSTEVVIDSSNDPSYLVGEDPKYYSRKRQ